MQAFSGTYVFTAEVPNSENHIMLSATMVNYFQISQVPILSFNVETLAATKYIVGWVPNNATVATRLIVRVAYI